LTGSAEHALSPSFRSNAKKNDCEFVRSKGLLHRPDSRFLSLWICCGYLGGADFSVHASGPIRSPVGPEGDPVRKISPRSNKPSRRALSIMPKNKPTTGPMSTQPVRYAVIPMISSVGKATRAPQPTQKSAKTEAIRVEKARMTRLNSLRKQREALKE
jgi:hypothetical protein